jgi:formate-nitrite transporter family protein
MAEATRLSAEEIFQGVTTNARAELARSGPALSLSGLAAGIAMGLTPLGVTAAAAALGTGSWAAFVASLAYPLGFVAVIIGRAQLFTENTLFPVVLVLDERRHLLAMLRLWGVVFCANVLGAACFALMAVKSGGLPPAVVAELAHRGAEELHHSARHVFASGVFAGWMVALVAWLVTGAQRTIGQIVLIWMLTVPIALLHLAHCIAGSASTLTVVVSGKGSVAEYLAWLAAATAGNIVGGVVIVSLLNFGQVRAGGATMRRRERRIADTQASFRELNEEQSDSGDRAALHAYVCECGDPGCREQLAIANGELHEVHANPARFVIARGHQIPGVEHVIEQRDGYSIVEKSGQAALYVADRVGKRG